MGERVDLAGVRQAEQISVASDAESDSMAVILGDAGGTPLMAGIMNPGQARLLARELLDSAGALEGAQAPPIKRALSISVHACLEPACGCGEMAVRMHDENGRIFAGMALNPGSARVLAAGIIAEAEKLEANAGTINAPAAGHA